MPTFPSMDIEGAGAIVSGGASGLGEATVRRLAAGGAAVTIVDLNTDRGEALAKELGGPTKFVKVDVSNVEQVAEAVAMAGEDFPLRIDVNCAGKGGTVGVIREDGTPHDFGHLMDMININLVGAFNMLSHSAAAMAQNEPLEDGERGVVINVASTSATEGQVGYAAYSAAKAGLVGLTLPAARDLADVGIRVNTISPGSMGTPMFARASDQVRAGLIAQIPFPKRSAHPDEFAHLVVAIIENRYINGETIRFDAGLRTTPS